MKTIYHGPWRGLPGGLVLFLLFFLLAAVPGAYAHARMVKSIPAKDAKITTSPAQLELWFNERLEDGFNTIEVFPAAELTADKHSNLATGKVTVDPKDRTHLTVTLGTLAPGDYVAEWRVLSRDGHSAPGRITFSVVTPK